MIFAVMGLYMYREEIRKCIDTDKVDWGGHGRI
jgi:dTDP-glucose pyrophosphorylase